VAALRVRVTKARRTRTRRRNSSSSPSRRSSTGKREENANVQGEFGDLGVVTFGIDEHGLWMEKAKDPKDAKDATDGSDAAAAPGGGGGDRDNEGTKDVTPRAQHKTHKPAGETDTDTDTDRNRNVETAKDGTDGTHAVHDDNANDEYRLFNDFEIEIHEGEDTKGLVDILRAAGYDVQVAELGDDGKYTVQNFGDGDYAETEAAGGEKGKKSTQSGDEQPPGHDEL
jgi:hypothetical protein